MDGDTLPFSPPLEGSGVVSCVRKGFTAPFGYTLPGRGILGKTETEATLIAWPIATSQETGGRRHSSFSPPLEGSGAVSCVREGFTAPFGYALPGRGILGRTETEFVLIL